MAPSFSVLRMRSRNRSLSPSNPVPSAFKSPQNYKGAGTPPGDSNLAVFPQPRYMGTATTFKGKGCKNLKADTAMMSYQGHDDWSYTFYRDADCKGKELEKNKGPNSRTNTYMVPMSVKIE